MDQLLVREQNCIQDPSGSGTGWPKHRPGFLHHWGEIIGLAGLMDQEMDNVGWLLESLGACFSPGGKVRSISGAGLLSKIWQLVV